VGQKSGPLNEPAEQIMEEIQRGVALPPTVQTSPTPDHYLPICRHAANPASISVANQQLRDSRCRRGVGDQLLLAFLVEQDHTAPPTRAITKGVTGLVGGSPTTG
jgi:hypothetical protein